MVQHPDPDDLTLLAIGEPIEVAIDAHLAECDQCRTEVDAMRRTVELAELSNYGEGTRQPSEHIWDAISAELGFGAVQNGNGAAHAPRAGAGTPWPVATEPDQASAPADSQDRPAPTDPPVLRAVPGSGTPERAPSRAADGARRWPRWAAPVAAVLIGAALGAGVLVVAQNRSESVTVEATAALSAVPTGPLAGKDTQGQAELVSSTQGQQVRVSATDLPAMPGTSYEVWLFGEGGKMISLGALDQGKGDFTVPGDISTQEYRTVDISDEPPDGNPTHSGISMIRGSFS